MENDDLDALLADVRRQRDDVLRAMRADLANSEMARLISKIQEINRRIEELSKRRRPQG